MLIPACPSPAGLLPGFAVGDVRTDLDAAVEVSMLSRPTAVSKCSCGSRPVTNKLRATKAEPGL
ncbi:hypothetical protein [Arthrobacter sp. AZCC_0090]|uniref:hypothetical protein n=1 Tax=Arthrobacter sp. AZCC_0090 TaxID=2735881 RepID=UPI00161761D8|nr:hypothetical protein [Arthrobacter sp. AZCC_0090]MBB6405172.1 hypothetical protein [Arthrobacter sp. AZCC_0090]